MNRNIFLGYSLLLVGCIYLVLFLKGYGFSGIGGIFGVTKHPKNIERLFMFIMTLILFIGGGIIIKYAI